MLRVFRFRPEVYQPGFVVRLTPAGENREGQSR